MPTYAYKCTECDNEFEIKRSAHDLSDVKCNQCGGAVKKIFFPVGIQFVGSGFHVNDYSKNCSSGSCEFNAEKKTTGCCPMSGSCNN